MPPGSHEIRLGGFSDNCRLISSSTQTVEVTAGGLTRDTSQVGFIASCDATTGDVVLNTSTAGTSVDPDGYTMKLDGQLLIEPCGWYDYGCVEGAPRRLNLNQTSLFEQLVPGDHTFEIGDIAENCTLTGSPHRIVQVAIGVITAVRFDVDCRDTP